MKVSSCCCCSLKAGTVILAVLTIIYGIYIVITAALADKHSMADPVLGVVSALTGILALIGANNRKPGFIFPLAALTLIEVIYVSPAALYNIINVQTKHGGEPGIYAVAYVIVAATFVLNAYFFVVLYSFQDELLREKYARLNNVNYSQQHMPSQIVNPGNVVYTQRNPV